MGAGSLDVIKPSAAGLVATTGAGRRPPPGCPPAGPVRVRGGGRSAAGAPGAPGAPPGAAISIGLFRHPSFDHPPPKMFSTSPIHPLHISNASVFYSTWGSFLPPEGAVVPPP